MINVFITRKYLFYHYQKQPPRNILQKEGSEKFRKTERKILVPECPERNIL